MRFCIVAFLFIANLAFGQDEPVSMRVDGQLRIKFPAKPVITTQGLMRVYSVDYDGVNYSVVTDSFYIPLDSLTRRVLDANFMLFDFPRIVDTVINQTKGRFLEYRDVQLGDAPIARLSFFVTTVNAHPYTLSVSQPTITEKNTKKVKAFYDSAEFGATWEDAWINFLTPFIVIIPIAIFLIMILKKKRKEI